MPGVRRMLHIGHREPLEALELHEWRGRYLPFPRLKHMLAAAVEGNETDAGALEAWQHELDQEVARIGEILDNGLVTLRLQLGELVPLSAGSSQGTQTPKSAPAEQESLDSSGGGTPGHWNSGSPMTQPSRGSVQVALGRRSVVLDSESLQELRVLEGLGRLEEKTQRLQSFAKLNHASLFQLMKQRDEALGGGTEGINRLLPRLIASSKLGDMDRFRALQGDIQEAFMQSPAFEGLDASSDVARMAAGITGKSVYSGMQRNECALVFFLGTFVTLIAGAATLLSLPVNEGADSFNPAYFMSNFSLFRIVLSIVLMLWGLGFVSKTCRHFSVNHIFILDIDPRSMVGPPYFFASAVLLGSALITVFIAYIADYKWELLDLVAFDDPGINKRASWHFLLYPVVLLIFCFVYLLVPFRLCAGRDKMALISSVGRVIAAPFFKVTFADNMMGDVLTSLTKPLQDVPAGICYLQATHPLSADDMVEYAAMGELCPPAVGQYLMPFLSALPLWFRLMQTARRYNDSGEVKHLYNFGKYAASILVVAVGHFRHSTAALVAVSVFSTTYSATWDVYMDWGLGPKELANIARLTEDEVDDPCGGDFLLPTEAMEHGAARGGRKLLLPKLVYIAAIVFDVAARCSWVLSLVSITVLTQNIWTREMFKTSMTALEIARRSIWAVLRIEHEQVSNSSKFRAFLWVPAPI